MYGPMTNFNVSAETQSPDGRTKSASMKGSESSFSLMKSFSNVMQFCNELGLSPLGYSSPCQQACALGLILSSLSINT
jgi:hypothetical protein